MDEAAGTFTINNRSYSDTMTSIERVLEELSRPLKVTPTCVCAVVACA